MKGLIPKMMKLYHKFFLYSNKIIRPFIRKVLKGVDFITSLAAVALIAGLVYEYGFVVPCGAEVWLARLYDGIWGVFLIYTTTHLTLTYRETRKKYRNITWALTGLLYLTLVPLCFHKPEAGVLHYFWIFLHSRAFRLILLLVFSFLHLSSDVIHLLGRRTNPSLILAGSFLLIICIGTGLLMLPRCTVAGISWVDSLFVSTSAVCVTGLVPVDVATVFTPLGQLIIILLIQVGGLGVMTFTCFFAMFFMGNTSLYNRLVIRDMISSDSLNSLLSTLVYILMFTLSIEAGGTLLLWLNIHGTLGMELQEELLFSAFHAVSAFCNAGFSTLSGNLGNPLIFQGHSGFYVIISLLIISGGIGFPILVNFKYIMAYHFRRLFYFIRHGKWERKRVSHLFNLNTKIVLILTTVLLFLGTVAFAVFEWNHAFVGMGVADKWVQAFFQATCPRTAGFTSVSLTAFSIPALLFMIGLMVIGGASQSTAGGIKINAFAVILLNLRAVLRGKQRVEVFHRQLSGDSIRRANATLVMYLGILFIAFFILSILEPEVSLFALVFECVSALSTVGASLDLTPRLGTVSKLVVVLLMFIGRVGVITFFWGMMRPQREQKYRYPNDNIIIN